MFGNGCTDAMYKHICTIIPNGSLSSTGKYISNSDGTRATSIFQHQRNFQSHLHSVMGGYIMPPIQHLSVLRAKCAGNTFYMYDNAFGSQPTDLGVFRVSPSHPFPAPPTPVAPGLLSTDPCVGLGCVCSGVEDDPGSAPSISQLTRRYACLRPKALGENRVGSELFRLCPDVFARLYHPLSTKVVVHCCPPPALGGGAGL